MFKNFTDAQKFACDISRHIAVTAGAGSGKTSVLVERYLWCLENNGYQVRRIVAITFTEKAAGEMLGRIRERILARAASGIGDSRRWEDVLENLPLANIATIHGFCQRLLREFPIEAGVDPQFEVFDEATKRICLTDLIDAVIQQRAAAYDANLARLADLWTPSALRNILLQLAAFRETSLAWARQILQESWPNYRNRLETLLATLQRRGIRQIAADPLWQETMQLIRTLPPEGDTSKLTARCLNLLDYDRQFRAQTELAEQLTTLAMLRQECRMITPSKKWQENGRNLRLAEALNHLKRLYDQALPPFEVQAELEKSGFALQQALADLLTEVANGYRQEKTARRVLDFDDLQESALRLLEQPAVHALLTQRYDYVMVDEFQDTNQMQWRLIQKLGTAATGVTKAKFCIVGDEKQSIYMFRGAEVAVFAEVRQALRQANSAQQFLTAPLQLPPFGDMPDSQTAPQTGEIILAENFRSLPTIIFFLNYLFARLLLPTSDPDRPYEARHQELLAGRKVSPPAARPTPNPSPKGRGTEAPLPFGEGQGDGENTHPVEFLFVQASEEAASAQTRLDEPELTAIRIGELARTRNYADIAILLRTRTRLKEFEQALRRAGIPFVVAGGIGFYQQQEIYDLVNLLRALVDSRQDIAFAGALRSPLFSFSDDQLLYLAAADYKLSSEDESPPTSPAFKGSKLTLWEKLAYHAKAADAMPAELDPPKFQHAGALFSSWQAQADRLPITHLLRRIFDDTGLYGILSSGRREIQSIINIEKFLDIARTLEGAGFQMLRDFVTYLERLIELEEREGEAQINFEGLDAVRLMTIHAAKGLEFPVVFVPELERPFNYGTSEPAYLDTLPAEHGALPALGIKGINPAKNYARENTFLREYLKRRNEEKTDAEMKRLLYVACTRAKDLLVLSGALAETVPSNSWLAWLLRIFPLAAAIPERRCRIVAETEHLQEIRELAIPIYLAEDYAKRQPQPAPGLAQQGRETEIVINPSPQEHRIVTFSVSVRGEPVEPERKPALRQAQGEREDAHFQDNVTALPPGWGWVARADSGTHPLPLPGGEAPIARTLRQNFAPLHNRANEIIRMNPSTIFTLWQCPRKYYYQELLKLPEFGRTPDSQGLAERPAAEVLWSEEPSPQRGKNRGTIIHRLFEKQVFDQPQHEADPLLSIERFLDELHISRAERQEMHLMAAINRAYQHYTQSGLRELLARSSRIYREYPFLLRIGRAELAGTIDVLCYDPQQAMWLILDYKSNEIETGQIPEEINRHGYDLQMQMYALAVSRLLQTDRLRSLLFFTFPGKVYDAVDLSPRMLTTRERQITSFLDQLAAGVLESAPKQAACEECTGRIYEACPSFVKGV